MKSLHGGYEPNEAEVLWNTIIGNRRRALTYLLRDRGQAGMVQAEIRFTDREKNWLGGEAGRAARTETAWRLAFPQNDLWQWRWRGIRTPEMLQKARDVEQNAEKLRQGIVAEARRDTITAQVIIQPSGEVLVTNSPTLLVAWSSFEPGNIGILDFHGSQRNYTREDLTQVTLNEDDEETRWRGGSLWNYENKYTNIKNAMAGEYIRSLVRRETAGEPGEERQLIPEMSRLMQRFLKGKKFAGPRIRGKGEIYFPVETADGALHDIDDLSSGEKEVVFGYLRAQTNTPRDSVIMIDEPELHLNPALMKGLARFYQEGMVNNQENQLWLVSHSDAFLRDAVSTDGVDVYHMQPALSSGENQIARVDKENEVQRLLIEIVGDMAAFKPKGLVLMVEGDRDDQWILETLFPEVEEQATVVGGGGYRQILEIRKVLEKVEESEGERREVFAITDGDWSVHGHEVEGRTARPNEYRWDRFHIENYLLEGEYISRAVRRLSRKKIGAVAEGLEIERVMCRVAGELVQGFAYEIVEREVRHAAQRATRISGQERKKGSLGGHVSYSNMLYTATNKIRENISSLQESNWTEESIRNRIQDEETRLHRSISDGTWKETFRGRDILKKFTDEYAGGFAYMTLKTEIVRQMQEEKYRPTGMATILTKIGISLRSLVS